MLTVARTVLSLSIMTANLPALKRFLYELQTGMSAAHLGKRQADVELSFFSWDPSKSATIKETPTVVLNELRRNKTQRRDIDGQSDKSEEGILRVVDFVVESERRSQLASVMDMA
jgi:hypothetical protein